MTESGFRNPARADGAQRLCFVVDDEPAICRMVSMALGNFGIATEHFHDVTAMIDGLKRRMPDLMLLDVSLGNSDAVDAIRALAAAGVGGPIYLMSGRDAALLEDVRLIGVRHGLNMGDVLTKPFRVEVLKRIADAAKDMGATVPTADDAASDAATGAQHKMASPRVSLGEALDKDWVELWYQPKVGLSDNGYLVGAEGLARVRHPDHGIMFPGNFIPGAEPSDLVRLAEHALRAALRDTSEFAKAGYAIQLAVNVPVEALINLPIGQIVRECRAGDPSEWGGIVLEVTEDQVINDIAVAHEIATQLRIHHVDLAIDDFGSGYSSLARLKELPFAELKLDRSFVDDCGDDPTNAALCKMVVDLAHRFGSLAVAEGIEKKTDLTAIRAMGCDIAQGFLFAHAMPKEFLLSRLLASGYGEFGAAIVADAENTRVA